MLLSVAVWHHSFDWGDNGVIEADLEALVFGSAEDDELTGWIRNVNGRHWFGPGAYEQVMTMLAADLLLPGLGLAFSGGMTRRG